MSAMEGGGDASHLAELMAELPVLPVERVLELLTAAPARSILATLHLSGGGELSGHILKVAGGRGAERTILLIGPEAHPVTAHLSWVPMSAVRAVSARLDARTLHLVSDGALLPPAGPPLSRLALGRHMQELAGRLSAKGARLLLDVAWATIPDGDGPRARVGATLDEATEILLRLLDDAAGRDAILALTTLTVRGGDVADVRRDGEVLEILARARGADLEMPRGPALLKAIERAL